MEPCTFTPVEQFDWVYTDENGNERFMGRYSPNASYNCTLEPRHDRLRAQLKVWMDEGKVRVRPLNPGEHFVTTKIKG